ERVVDRGLGEVLVASPAHNRGSTRNLGLASRAGFGCRLPDPLRLRARGAGACDRGRAGCAADVAGEVPCGGLATGSVGGDRGGGGPDRRDVGGVAFPCPGSTRLAGGRVSRVASDLRSVERAEAVPAHGTRNDGGCCRAARGGVERWPQPT